MGDQYLKYGKFLRKTKIDEALQVINVIRGQMNLVGPRPELVEHSYLIPKDIRKILLSRKPGLTSLASIAFADEEQLISRAEDYWLKVKPIKIALDVFYVEHRDVFLDVWILWKTAVIVLRSFFK